MTFCFLNMLGFWWTFHVVPCSWSINESNWKASTSSNSEWTLKHHCKSGNSYILGKSNARWLQWSQKKGIICTKSSCQSTCLTISTVLTIMYFWNPVKEFLRWFNIWVICQANPTEVMSHVTLYGPALSECLKDGNTPVRLAAERCALHSFQLARGIFFCCISFVSILIHLSSICNLNFNIYVSAI